MLLGVVLALLVPEWDTIKNCNLVLLMQLRINCEEMVQQFWHRLQALGP